MKIYVATIGTLAMIGLATASIGFICNASGTRTETEAETLSVYEQEDIVIAPYKDRTSLKTALVTEDATTVSATDTESEMPKFYTAEHELWELEWYMNDYTRPTIRQYTDDEKILLQKIASAEGYTLGPEGMAHIMRVVLNRVESSSFPNTIAEVIYQDGQFAVVYNGTFDSALIDDSTETAFEMIESGWDETYGATFFCTESSANTWHSQTLTEMYRFENVIFWTYLAEY